MIGEWVVVIAVFVCIGLVVLCALLEVRRRNRNRWKHHPIVLPTECHRCHMPVLMLRVMYADMVKRHEEVLCEKCEDANKNISARRTDAKT